MKKVMLSLAINEFIDSFSIVEDRNEINNGNCDTDDCHYHNDDADGSGIVDVL